MTAPKRYRKKPEPPVEAVQWTGENLEEVAALLDWDQFKQNDSNGSLWIEYREGWGIVWKGSFIARHTDGTLERIQPKIFQATYEEVADSEGVELTGENALTADEARALGAFADAFQTLAAKNDDLRLHEALPYMRSAVPKLRAALTQHTTSEGGSDS